MKKKINLSISALSLTNIHYVIAKLKPEQVSRRILFNLLILL
jgi:hypothetical protein